MSEAELLLPEGEDDKDNLESEEVSEEVEVVEEASDPVRSELVRERCEVRWPIMIEGDQYKLYCMNE
jgi:hypothetical protein